MRLTSKSAILTATGVVFLGTSLALSSAGVVSGASASGVGRFFAPAATCSLGGGYCLTESNTATGTNAHGAIKGTTTGENAMAIFGTGSGKYSIGVQGNSTGAKGTGVEGVSQEIGVSGISTGSTSPSYETGALTGTAEGVNGVYGFSRGRDGGFFESNTANYDALFLLADNANGAMLGASNSATDSFFDVDANGNGVFSGIVEASGFQTDVRTRDGQHLGAFNAQSTRPTIEDTGTARMTNGEGSVRFDSAFSRSVDLRQGYQVFLTPDGETRGLFVSGKYEGGFMVREIEHGRSTIYFDYRVVAHPVGSTIQRLPQLRLPRMSRTNPGQVLR